MARVVVIAARDGLAGPLVRALRDARHVEACERASQDPAHIDPSACEGFDTVVYSALPAEDASIGPDVDAARAVSASLASLPLKQVVVVSSAAVYGADHRNVGLLDETAFLAEGRSEIADRWRAVESLTRTIGERTNPARTLLRPAAVLDGADYFSRLLTCRVAITYSGFDPTLQLLSPHDLAGAISTAIERRSSGIYNVAPAGGIPLRHALRVAGVRRLPIPRMVQRAVRSIAAPAGLAVPSEQLTYIQHSWTVSAEKLRAELGFCPPRSSARAILELIGRDGGEGGATEPEGFDAFGMDPAYIARYCRHLFHFLHQYYWRVELTGLEHVPRRGRGVLVGMHRGFMPFDGVMALYALVRRAGRIPRFLIHPSLTKFPFLADFMAKVGGIMACQENADYVLQHDELLGVFPEGIRGAFKRYKDAYVLGKFGRDEFVRMALRNRAPLVPFVTVGSAEIFPILGRIDWSGFKRYTEWPFLPITAPFPLPSKWHTQFLPPVHVEEIYPAEAAADAGIVRLISLDIRRRMQAAIDDMLSRRRSIFFGSLSPRG